MGPQVYQSCHDTDPDNMRHIHAKQSQAAVQKPLVETRSKHNNNASSPKEVTLNLLTEELYLLE